MSFSLSLYLYFCLSLSHCECISIAAGTMRSQVKVQRWRGVDRVEWRRSLLALPEAQPIQPVDMLLQLTLPADLSSNLPLPLARSPSSSLLPVAIVSHKEHNKLYGPLKLIMLLRSIGHSMRQCTRSPPAPRPPPTSAE